MKTSTVQPNPTQPSAQRPVAPRSVPNVLPAHEAIGDGKLVSASWPSLLPRQLIVDGVTYLGFGYGSSACAYRAEARVLKVGHTFKQARQIRVLANDPNPDVNAQKIVVAFNTLVQSVASHLTSGRLDPRLVANAQIDQKDRIWMDYTPAVETCFGLSSIGKHDNATLKKLIDRFASFFLLTFKSGTCERECSLFTNYGFFPTTRTLACFDFGAMTFNYEQARRSVAGTVTKAEVRGFMLDEAVPLNPEWPDWFAKGQVREALRPYPQLFRYFVEHMAERVNLKSLNRMWPREFR